MYGSSNSQVIFSGLVIKNGDKYCVVHAGTKKKYDQWQYEKLARLVEIIPDKYKLKVLLTCGPSEEFQVESIINLVQGKRVACVQTGLQELGAITKGASFVLCHNGGYMHMASVLGASVIALFGVVHPRVWRPLGQRDVVIY